MPLTQLVLEVRRQLRRMLLSSVFASRPRCSQMLQFFAEESIRNGFAPLSQHLIATHGLGFGADFSPARSAEVRVKVARLRVALQRYYRGPGRDDPIVLSISRRPYRLVATTNGSPDLGKAATDACPPRRERPTLLVVEPEISGPPEHDGLGLRVSLQVLTLLVEDSFLTVSGPLRRDRIAALAESPVRITAQLGYDYAVETAIRIEETRWRVRATITDTKRGEPVADVTRDFDPQPHFSPADEIGGWICHRIGTAFVAWG